MNAHAENEDRDTLKVREMLHTLPIDAAVEKLLQAAGEPLDNTLTELRSHLDTPILAEAVKAGLKDALAAAKLAQARMQDPVREEILRTLTQMLHAHGIELRIGRLQPGDGATKQRRTRGKNRARDPKEDELVLSLARRSEGVQSGELMETLGLPKKAVSKICDRLVEEGHLQAAGRGSRGNRFIGTADRESAVSGNSQRQGPELAMASGGR